VFFDPPAHSLDTNVIENLDFKYLYIHDQINSTKSTLARFIKPIYNSRAKPT